QEQRPFQELHDGDRCGELAVGDIAGGGEALGDLVAGEGGHGAPTPFLSPVDRGRGGSPLGARRRGGRPGGGVKLAATLLRSGRPPLRREGHTSTTARVGERKEQGAAKPFIRQPKPPRAASPPASCARSRAASVC